MRFIKEDSEVGGRATRGSRSGKGRVKKRMRESVGWRERAKNAT